jgi:Bacterial pre-peptidase C-terminal domain
MGKTKIIKVSFPGWQLGIFSITINLLVLAIQPRLTLAQTKTNPANSQTASNTAIANLEPEILSEINRVRTSPQDYAQWLEQQRQYYDGIWVRLPGEKPVRTNRGRDALEEAIAFLKQQQPLPPLEKSSQTAAAAISELENFAHSNNIQYFSYGKKTASGIVMDLVVDELFPDRRRRQSLLSPEAEDTGVACKPDPRYAKVCAIAYSDSPIHADVATAQPDTPATPEKTVTTAQPETPVTPEETVTTAPPETPVTPEETVTTAQPETPVTPEEIVTTAPPETPVTPEETVTTAPPEVTLPGMPVTNPNLESQQPSDESVAEETEETEVEESSVATNDPAANLPTPPQPQAPPASAVNDDPQPSQEAKKATAPAENSQIAQAESEIEQEQKKLAENDQESDTEIANSDQSEEVAINSETAGLSEKVEKGSLEKGDRVIEDDGSLYDFYPIQGKAGESVTINLESDMFDAFVALVDSNGKTVGENDDISPEDSNSQLSVTLPEDGVYNVIVNTYDENGTGEYVLKVSR